MPALRHTLLLSAALTAWVAPSLGAQESKCDIDIVKPAQLTKAFLSLQAAHKESPDARGPKLKAAVAALTDKPERIKNTTGRNFLLGQALTLWLDVPSVANAATVKRADLGYLTEPEAQIDPVLATDSAFTAVETAMPGCAAEVTMWRRQQPWLNYVNNAVKALNEKKTDSAEYLAKRSLVLFRGAPYGYNILAGIAQERRDYKQAVEMLRKTAETAKGDTSLADIYSSALFNIGALTAFDIESDSSPARAARVKAAVEAFEHYLKEVPNDPNAPTAKAELARLRVLSGDTAAVTALYADMLANPSKFSDTQLFEAGLQAARAERDKDAAKLFKAGLDINPHSRDGLYNLAAVYFNIGQFADMLPVTKRLVEIDPSNPENWRLVAAAYQGISKSEKNPRVKRAQTDSLVQAFEKYEKLPVSVTFTMFRHDGPQHTLAGAVENRGTAAKAYTIRFEFLDAKGTVVATQEAAVGPVAPKQKKTFSVDVNKDGIVAFRYAPVS